MIEAVYPDLFRIEVPLPKNPLRSINSYVIRGGDRNLVVDTGMNRPECQDALQAGLKELGVDAKRTDFFITHFHADHLDLAGTLASETSRVFLNKPEAEYMTALKTSGGFPVKSSEHARLEGFPEEGLRQVTKLHPGFKCGPSHCLDFEILKDGDRLCVGEYAFACVHTPGHTVGHLCLYEARKKLLLSGDHVLGGITPNIASWIDDSDMLASYLASLDKVSLFDVELVLPGHRQTFPNLRERIRELKEHHERRLEEVLVLLRERPGTVYEVASQMTWDIVAKSWEEFPVMQKWFATGEAGSHLRHLEAKGLVRRSLQDGTFTYALR
jgi:glyoxylase-like metal-dependent hydrolase (beta-lactamase superfamily II)